MSGPFGLGGELARSRQDIDGGQKSGSGKSLGRVVGDAEFCPPSMLTVYQEGEMGVLRPSGGANAVAGCWPTCRE
jgi:hypothetical protein